MTHTTVQVKSDSAPTSPPGRAGAQVVLLLTVCAAVFYAYFVQATEGVGTSKNPKSAMRWMVGHWEELSNYSHGPLIPLISAGLILRRSKRFRRLWDSNHNFQYLCYGVGALVAVGMLWESMPRAITGLIEPVLRALGRTRYDYQAVVYFLPLFAALGFYLTEQKPTTTNHRWGLALVGFSVLLYFAGVRSAQTHSVVASFILLLYGLSLYLWGREASRALVFPIAFLFLMVPLNFLDRLTVPLSHMATASAAFVCNLIGVEVHFQGVKIFGKSGFMFEVAEACSGIRSLVALGMVTAVYAYLTEPVQWKRWAIFVASIPLAILGNVGRVTTIMLVAQAGSQELAHKYHDYSSFIFFPVALMGMLVFAVLLNLNYRRVWNYLTRPAAPPSGPPEPTAETP